ncbi:periplasmic heavy metal sensor [Pseudoduganella sp. FT25W]|uniref:Periplasmic heavy metal sensor n=1 Tax=Duganella alba TaxID=2666081 RepID=A0A6L5QJS4_9BURK|nr:periplasmic heavy metal sensor [Duganella alba]MRX09897.1 periplasmic heavy metal sensor [Duganella alba]MRX17534.1 periplasmic heavy metal sensor [Duganella alba]
MKTSKQHGRNFLLAAVLAMPLFAMGGAARADETNADQPPPMAQGEQGPRGPQGDDRGPGGPDEHGGPRGGPEHGGPGFGPGFGPGPGFGGHPPFFRSIDLNEAQQDKVFAILHAEAPYLREQGKAAAKAREALHALATADKYDDAKAAALAKEAATAEANIVLQHVRTQQKLLAVLTPEQRKKQADEKPRHPPRD